MKKCLCLLSILFIMLTAGCFENKPNGAPEQGNPEVEEQPVNQTDEALTEADVIELFSARSDCEATGCVLSPDFAFGLIGVVQYSADGCCNLAFVDGDGFFQSVGFDTETADDSVLTYIGGGAVTLSLRAKDSGEISDCTVEYSKDEAGVHFKASSKPRDGQ